MSIKETEKLLGRAYAKDQVFLEIAMILGELSTCDRAAVGAVIVRDGRCVTWGFNGAPPGLPHCSEAGHSEHPALVSVRAHISGAKEGGEWVVSSILEEYFYPPLVESLGGCRNATHAEANALSYAARQGISTEGGTLYVSISPCLDCARLLVAAGISRTVASKAYRETAGVELLREAGVIVEVH